MGLLFRFPYVCLFIAVLGVQMDGLEGRVRQEFTCRGASVALVGDWWEGGATTVGYHPVCVVVGEPVRTSVLRMGLGLGR
jgi:hypothetical protein